MEDNAIKVRYIRRDDFYIDPRRQKEYADFSLMPSGVNSIANLDPKGFQKTVYYESDKKDGAN